MIRNKIMFEHWSKPLLPREVFYRRVLRHFGIALFIIFGSLVLGVLGYHYLAEFPWLDALLNASMILSGMGPVQSLDTNSGKLFASFYALFSGIAFITTAGIIFAPVFHRFLHKFHLDVSDDSESKN